MPGVSSTRRGAAFAGSGTGPPGPGGLLVKGWIRGGRGKDFGDGDLKEHT